MDMQPVNQKDAGVILAIVGGFLLISGIVNFIIERASMHENISYEDQIESSKKLQD